MINIGHGVANMAKGLGRGVTNFNKIDHRYFVGFHSLKFIHRTYAHDDIVPVSLVICCEFDCGDDANAWRK